VLTAFLPQLMWGHDSVRYNLRVPGERLWTW